MDRKVRQRVMRSFIAALLQSELSLEELRQLSFDISTGTFGAELSRLLEESIFALRGSGAHEGKDAPDGVEDFVSSVIQKRRLSKKAVLEMMSSASPKKALKDPNTSASMREVLERFFRTASSSEISKFLNLLDPGETKTTEAYLRGIIRRD
jgi:hypothetical protein